jgi:hypothetical protein
MPRIPATAPVPIDTLRTLFRYDEDAGVLIRLSTGVATGVQWKKSKYHRYGWVDLQKRKRAQLHRVVFAVVHGRWPEGQIDHIDGDPTNNRIENLREVSGLENQRNMKRYTSNTSGYTGVRRTASGKWQALITDNGRRIHLGVFEDVGDAAAAYRAKADELGYHKNHGR